MLATTVSICGRTHVNMFKKSKALSGIENNNGYSKVLTYQIAPELLEG
jgi:hypothetical protein